MAVSADPHTRLVTHALGSCLGVAVFDPVVGVAGLLHAVLPLSSADREKARTQPLSYVDTAVPLLFRACYRLGARKQRMVVAVAGAAAAAGEDDADGFQIGKRNLVVLRRLLWKNGILIRALDVGGRRLWRTLALEVSTGRMLLTVNGVERVLDPDGGTTHGRKRAGGGR